MNTYETAEGKRTTLNLVQRKDNEDPFPRKSLIIWQIGNFELIQKPREAGEVDAAHQAAAGAE